MLPSFTAPEKALLQERYPAASSRQKFQSIEVLRGFAAMYVFIFHARVPLVTPWEEVNKFFLNLIYHGIVGVDLFFVISGFVLAWSCVLSREKPESVREFAIKRFFRVVLLYWIATALSTLLIDRLLTGVDSWPKVFKSLAFVPSANVGQPFFDYAQLIPGWTLNYEMLFYLVFGLGLVTGRRVLLLAPVVVACLVLGSQVATGHAIELNPFLAPLHGFAYASMATNPIILEFVIGIGTAVLFKHLQFRVPRAAAVVGLIVGVVGYATAVFANPTQGHHVVYLALPSAVLVLTMALAERHALVKYPGWAVELGALSFAIYLFHPFVQKLCRGMDSASRHWLIVGIASCIIQTVIMIWLARKVHRRLELPLIAKGRRILKGEPWLVFAKRAS